MGIKRCVLYPLILFNFPFFDTMTNTLSGNQVFDHNLINFQGIFYKFISWSWKKNSFFFKRKHLFSEIIIFSNFCCPLTPTSQVSIFLFLKIIFLFSKSKILFLVLEWSVSRNLLVWESASLRSLLTANKGGYRN